MQPVREQKNSLLYFYDNIFNKVETVILVNWPFVKRNYSIQCLFWYQIPLEPTPFTKFFQL